MALISLRQLLDHAAENSYGMPAFNVNNMEQVHAIMQAADAVNSPVIMQGSAGARAYAGEPFLRHLISAAVEMYPHIPVDVTREVVKLAHAGGVSVEGELGCLGSLETGEMGEEDGHGAEGKLDMDQLLTGVDEAADFVEATGVDALAIAIGTSHGAYKFTKEPDGEILRIDRIKEIHTRLPNTHLVMHGSSSVPQDWLEIINTHGGDMGQTYGVPVEEIVEGIKNGVRKVNIDTDLRMASTGAIRKHLIENPANFDPRKFLKASTEAMKGICQARFESFGCAGQASKITPMSLDAMAQKYAA